MQRATETLERVGTALSDPTRRRILLVLLDGPAYPAEASLVRCASSIRWSN